MMKIQFQAIEGYAYGAIQPSTIFRFSVNEVLPSDHVDELVKLFSTVTTSHATDIFEYEDVTPGPNHAPTLFIGVLAALTRHSGDRRLSTIKAFAEGDTIVYALPTLSTDMTWHTLIALSKFLKDTNYNSSEVQLAELLNGLKSSNRKFLPGGTNTMNFLNAAAQHKIPFKIFRQNYLILGYASGSTILKSSITDQETSIGVSLARSKVDTNRLLKLSGLPVPDQARIQTITQAKHFAGEFGYPVVLKPEDESQGRGIYANIRDEKELIWCFEQVANTYPILLIEKHITGDHYRIDFMGEELIKAVRRRPPEVVGDGIRTLRELIAELNLDPERLDPYSSKKIVVLDEDLERCIKKQQVSLDDVLETKRIIYLKSISNLSRGGDQIHVEDNIHPENFKLCQMIARTMRLDVLGIDLLSPDLSKPWHSNGTVVCEVNAQPQLGASGTDVYWRFMKNYLRPPVRIEVEVTNDTSQSKAPLFDTEVSRLKIKLSVADAFSQGCPVQYFQDFKIADDVAAADRRRLERLFVSVNPEGA